MASTNTAPNPPEVMVSICQTHIQKSCPQKCYYCKVVMRLRWSTGSVLAFGTQDATILPRVGDCLQIDVM